MSCSSELKQAADTLSQSPASLQLRYLQTLLELGADQNSTVVFPLPMDIVGPLLKRLAPPDGTEALVPEGGPRSRKCSGVWSGGGQCAHSG